MSVFLLLDPLRSFTSSVWPRKTLGFVTSGFKFRSEERAVSALPFPYTSLSSAAHGVTVCCRDESCFSAHEAVDGGKQASSFPRDDTQAMSCPLSRGMTQGGCYQGDLLVLGQ